MDSIVRVRRRAMRKTGRFLNLVLCLPFLLSGCASIGRNIYSAASKGNTQEVQKYLNEGADVNARDGNGITPLMYAVRNGDIQMVTLLIDKGADVNAKSIEGWTALMYAAAGGKVEIVKLLIDKGADVNATNINGNTAWMLTLKYRISLEKETGPSHRIEQLDKVVQLLVDNGADVQSEAATFLCPIFIYVEEIDGRLTPIASAIKDGKLKANDSSVIEYPVITLSPGFHKVGVSLSLVGVLIGKSIALDIDAERGGIYWVNYGLEQKKGEWRAWIERFK